jgi:hypothetical protein
MSDIRNQHELDELHKRLYARDSEPLSVARHQLSDTPTPVATNWNVREPASENTHGYRKVVLLASIGIFLAVAALATAYFFFGNSRISGDNIAFNIAGATNISGGEVATFQIGVTNQNTVAIEGAALIIRYPEGTQSVEEPVRNLCEERLEVGTLAPGEVKNIQIQAVLYGKENQQTEIRATLEYRLVGSDGVYYKEANPITVQIVSSPLLLQVTAVKKVSAGQPVTVVLAVTSNASKPLKDILITARYPNGFTFKIATPEPLYSQNVWKIAELVPEETEIITIEGVVEGLTNEAIILDFSAGAALADNEFIVGSLLAEARTEFVIEQPFIAVDVSIAGDDDRSVVLPENGRSVVEVTVKNTLTEPVFDMMIEVVPSGNALKNASIQSRQGFYDSNTGTVRFDSTNTPDLVTVEAGREERVNFSIDPAPSPDASAFTVAVNVYAKRVADPAAQQQLVGTVSAEARYSSVPSLTSSLTTTSGPIPPRVGQPTSYLATLTIGAGSNNITNAIVKTVLPSYITWGNEYRGKGRVSYNPVSRELVWEAGDVSGGDSTELTFLVTLLPSLSQVDINPIVVQGQTLNAIDRFTNTPVSASGAAITTELPDYADGSGQVQQ